MQRLRPRANRRLNVNRGLINKPIMSSPALKRRSTTQTRLPNRRRIINRRRRHSIRTLRSLYRFSAANKVRIKAQLVRGRSLQVRTRGHNSHRTPPLPRKRIVEDTLYRHSRPSNIRHALRPAKGIKRLRINQARNSVLNRHKRRRLVIKILRSRPSLSTHVTRHKTLRTPAHSTRLSFLNLRRAIRVRNRNYLTHSIQTRRHSPLVTDSK